ncbi:MAG: magnesium transporter [Clostridia bacterium]|nr:magnesium transporter [Clostridia bacterium]
MKNTPAVAATNIPDYRAEISALLKSRLTPGLIRNRLDEYHGNDIASVLSELTEEDRKRLYGILDTAALAQIFEYCDDPNDYMSELPMRKRADVLSLFEASQAADILRNTEKNCRNMLLELMDGEIRKEITLLDSFDQDEIGSRMSTNYVSVTDGCGIREAMKELIRQAADNDNISTIYVTDTDGRFVGAIDLKDLIIARDSSPIDSIIQTTFPFVYANEQTDYCLERIRGYSEDSIPVLDQENRLIGVLTSQNLTELVGDALEEDYAMLAGLSSEEDINEPLRHSVGKRLPWLTILLGLSLAVSAVAGIFEGIVSELAVIVGFQSLVLGMSGNVGTQSLAVTIRVLTDEQVGLRQKLYLIGKECRVGLVNGLILGSLSFAVIGGYLTLVKSLLPSFAFTVSFCIGAALLLSMVLSSISGTVIPILFKKLKLDPAVASGPLITTVNDLVAVISYYGLAWLMLAGTVA